MTSRTVVFTEPVRSAIGTFGGSLKDINTRVAAAASVSLDDMMITLYEVPGENISFGRGEAQRANAVAHA
jgi:hypothetical protein